MRKLTLGEADQIIDAALAKGRELKLGKLTVVVLDDGGHPIAMKQEDGSEFLRPRIATAKAWGALGMGLASRVLHQRSQELPVFFGVLNELADGGMVALPGGVIIRDEDGSILGAEGVSGDQSEPDEAAAVAGVEAVGSVPTSAPTRSGCGRDQNGCPLTRSQPIRSDPELT